MFEKLRRKIKKSAFFIIKPENADKVNLVINELEIKNVKIIVDYELAKEIIFNTSEPFCSLIVCDEDLLSDNKEEEIKALAKKNYLPFEIFSQDNVRSIREAFLMAFYQKYKKH